MISILCPYCGGIKCILFDPCMHELVTEGKSIVECFDCNKKYVVYNGDMKFKVEKIYECGSNDR